ncbi:anticodon-binding aminoacyl-tRNA synthetase, class 1a [Tanacetum coccineum]
MDSDLNIQDDQWEPSLDIDDPDLRLTPILRPSSRTPVSTPPSTQNPVRIIPSPAGIVQAAKLLKQMDILLGLDGAVMSTQEYMKKVVEDVSEDDDFKSGSLVSATDYVNANGGTVSGCLGDIKNFWKNKKLDQVVAIVKSCSSNVIDDLTVTMKDLTGTIPGTIHHKVIGDDGYGKDITVRVILANISVFSHKPSMHYLNITKRNVIKVFRKDTVPGSGSTLPYVLLLDDFLVFVVEILLCERQSDKEGKVILLCERQSDKEGKVTEPGTTLPDERRYFSELKEEQLLPSFCKVPKFRFVPCNVFLTYINDDGKATPRRFRWLGANKIHTYDPPKDTAHTKAGSGHHQLFGTIQAAAFSLDPASPSFSMFNRNYKDPILVPNLGFLSPHNICYCSIPFSTSVKIATKLNVTTDPVDDMKDSNAYYDYYRDKVPGEEYNDAFEVCNNCEVINFSDYFAKRPGGGSDSCTLKGRDGYLKLYYVALKYAVDAALEVAFESTSKETKVVGRVKVDWKLPPFADETTLAKTSYYADLAKKQVYTGIPKHTPITMEKDGRWSLQGELLKLFHCIVNYNFPEQEEEAFISISAGTKADGCDYLCTTVLDIWPASRSACYYHGPKHAGMTARDTFGAFSEGHMLKRCAVGGPGFLKFKLCGKWVATSIHKMLTHGIDKLAPKPPVKKTIIDFLSRNVATKMHMDHIRSAIIGETLACIIEYSGVHVQRKFRYGDHLDIKSKMMMTELLIERFPNGEVDDQAIGELEVLYKDSKKRFDEDAEFRKRAQQDWQDVRHQNAWVRICKISRARYQKVYQRLGVSRIEEGKELYDQYIRQTQNLLMAISEGDEAIFIEGPKLPLVDIAALWRALEIDKADRIKHVSDVGQRDDIELCIIVAKRLGLTVNKDPLSHVAVGPNPAQRANLNPL